MREIVVVRARDSRGEESIHIMTSPRQHKSFDINSPVESDEECKARGREMFENYGIHKARGLEVVQVEVRYLSHGMWMEL